MSTIKINVIRMIFVLLLLGTFYIIFGFSNQDGEKSGNLSKKVTEIIINQIDKIHKLSEEKRESLMDKMHIVVRKLAHFSIYTLVGIFTMGFLCTYNIKNMVKIYISLITGIIYAFSDEIHQAFIAGRSSQLTDVLIDSMGVVFGIVIVLIVCKLFNVVKNRKIDSKST